MGNVDHQEARSAACICDPWEIGKTPACPVHGDSAAQGRDVCYFCGHSKDDHRINAIGWRCVTANCECERFVPKGLVA